MFNLFGVFDSLCYFNRFRALSCCTIGQLPESRTCDSKFIHERRNVLWQPVAGRCGFQGRSPFTLWTYVHLKLLPTLGVARATWLLPSKLFPVEAHTAQGPSIPSQ
jgi:hypothetical protein